MAEFIPLSVPFINGNEWEYVKECLDTGWISSAGKYVDLFERKIEEYTGAKHAVAVMNGTAAIHLSLELSGVKNTDCVLLPSLTFVATANAVSYTGAEPVFIDSKLDDWQMDPLLLKKYLEENCYSEGNATFRKKDKKRIAAIIPVHIQGNIGEIEELVKIAGECNIKVVEDSAEALGSKKNGISAGRFGSLGCFSFNGNKIISSGGGGMIVTDNEELAKRAKHLSTTAKVDPLNYYHDEVGYNYRMVNVLAALGVAQLEKLNEYVLNKQSIGDRYRSELNGVGDISFQSIDDSVDYNNWLFTISTSKQSELLGYLNENKIMSRPFWMPMHLLPMYSDREYYTIDNNAETIYKRSLAIPCSPDLSQENQERVIATIQRFFKEIN